MTWQPGDDVRTWTPPPGRTPLSSVHACECESWSLWAWPKVPALDRDTGEVVGEHATPVRRPMLCGSWRCMRCALWRGAVDWSRCRVAVTSRRWWLYAVLTCDTKDWPTRWLAFKEMGKCWDSHLRQALRSRLKRAPLPYLQTWESTIKGYPHVNVLLGGEALRRDVEAAGPYRTRQVETAGGKVRTAVYPPAWRQWLLGAARRAGFGDVGWVEVIEDTNPDAMAGYLLKLARELTGAPGGSKGEQSPCNAPKHFRRIRSSKGLLPPGPKTGSPDWSGVFVPERCVREPSPRRKTGARPPAEPMTWEQLERLLAALARPEVLERTVANAVREWAAREAASSSSPAELWSEPAAPWD